MKNTSEIQVELSRGLKNLMHQLRQCMDKEQLHLGITSAQYTALSVLTELPEVSGAEIARKCRVTPQTAHQLLTALESNGWVKREPHPTNEKVLLVKLTAEGDKQIKKVRPERLKVLQAMLKGFSTAELQSFKSLVDRSMDNLSGN